MSGDAELGAWLDQMLDSEPDLRASRGAAREAERGRRVPQVILLEEGMPAAYAELRRVGRAIELATVVVDPSHRGKGLSHQLVREAWSRWRQDPILHGASLGGEVNLVAATRGDAPPEIIRGPLVSFTRDAAMAAALVGGGFTLMPRRRRASRLWLVRSDFAALPLSIQLAFALDRTARALLLLFTRPRRILHHLRHARDYRLFVRIPETAARPPPRLHDRTEREGGTASALEGFDAVGISMEETSPNSESISAWDEGE